MIFDSDELNIKSLIRRCEEFLERDFGFPITLTVVDSHSLKEALDHAPEWWGKDPDSKHNALFVIPPATAEEIIAEVGGIRPEYEQIGVYQNVIFWSAPLKTFSRTRWSKIAGTDAYKYVTIRNSNTARKLLELALN